MEKTNSAKSLTVKPTLLLFPLLLVFYEIAAYLSNDMYLPALPVMMKELSLNSEQAQLTLTTWFLGQASLPLLVGILSDRFGRRAVLLCGGVIYVLATIGCALTSSATGLFLARFIEGGMVATVLVPGYATIHELYKQTEAIKILALMGSISVLAPAFGPLFGGFVLSFTDWRGIFWIIAIWATLALVLLWIYMPETHSKEKRKTIQWKILCSQYFKIISNLRFMSYMLVLGSIFAGWIVWISAGSLLVIKTFHHSEIAFGWIQAIIFMAFILGARTVKFVIDRLGPHRLIQVGLVITLTGGILLLPTAYYFPDALFPFLAAMLVYSFGSGLCFAPLNRMTIEASDEPMGTRVAIFAVFLTGSAACGSALSSFFFDGSLMSLAYLIAAAITFSCLLKASVFGIK